MWKAVTIIENVIQMCMVATVSIPGDTPIKSKIVNK